MEYIALSPTAVLCAIVVLLLLEWISPWRRATVLIQHRWLTNIGLMLCGGVFVTILFPASVQLIAADMESGWMRQLPFPLEAILLFLLLDCWRYWEHRIFHEVPLLWRVHLVHHSDTCLDITTGERHHPLEAALATCTALLLVFALGFSAQALAIYLGVATLSALWTHANITLPESIDKPLRAWLVTPAVHAVHHSDLQPETDSNYGTVLTVWDRLFSTYTDPASARIPHFGLEYFHRPRDTALAAVLLQPFEYRAGMHYPARESVVAESAAPRTVISAAWRQALLHLTIGLALTLFALWPTLLSLFEVWGNSEPYQYAWLVLPMFLYVVGWYHRDRILAMAPRPDPLGLVVILGAALVWSIAAVVDIQVGQHLAFVVILQGIALCALGRTVYRQLFPIMAMLFMMVPSGDVLQPLLRELTVKWIEWFTVVLNLPHTVDGFMIYIGDHRYVVIDECSGLTFVTLAGFLGYSFGVLLFRSFSKILALAAVGAALGILTNALRVWMIVGIDWLQGSQMDMAAHMDLQWLALLLALGVLFYLTARLANNHETADTYTQEVATEPKWQATQFAPLLAGLLVLMIVTPVQRLGAQTQVNTDDQLKVIAASYPQSAWLNDGADQAGRSLLIPGDSQLDIVIAEPDRHSGRIDDYKLGPEGHGVWRHTDTSPYIDCSGEACVQFVHKTWRRKESNDARHAFYAYYVGDGIMASELSYRLASGWDRISGAGSASGLIGFKVRGDLPAQHILAEAFHNLQTRLNGNRRATAGNHRSTGNRLALIDLQPGP